jgi:hypothetical protein
VAKARKEAERKRELEEAMNQLKMQLQRGT